MPSAWTESSCNSSTVLSRLRDRADRWAKHARGSRLASGQNPRAINTEVIFAQSLSSCPVSICDRSFRWSHRRRTFVRPVLRQRSGLRLAPVSPAASSFNIAHFENIARGENVGWIPNEPERCIIGSEPGTATGPRPRQHGEIFEVAAPTVWSDDRKNGGRISTQSSTRLGGILAALPGLDCQSPRLKSITT